MTIIKLEKIDSTHNYLKELIKNDGYSFPICITTSNQTNGIGSRGNLWQGIEGNLFFSFALHKKDLPQDLELQSTSIYFSYILKDLLFSKGSKIWLKWPNDFYIEEKKIGGTITTATKDLIYCGIGLNLLDVEEGFGKLDIQIDSSILLKEYFENLKKQNSWKEIFSQFKIDFIKSKNYKVTINDKKVSLKNATLNNDGSIQIDNKKVFSLR